MLVVVWVVVLDSESEITISDVLVPEDGSVSRHSSLDLESNSVSEWVSWEVNSLSVKIELLCIVVLSTVTILKVSSLGIRSVDHKALSIWSSDGSNQVGDLVESELLVRSGGSRVAISSNDDSLDKSVIIIISRDRVGRFPG